MQMGIKADNRIEYFDIAKGITIILVILGHCQCPDLLHRFIYSVHMPIFFLISGYFTKKKNTKQLMVSKVKHLLLPYFLTGITGLAASSIWIWQTSQGSWKQNILNWLWAIFYGAGNGSDSPIKIIAIGAVWFLLASFFASIIFNICLKSRYIYFWVVIISWAGYATMRVIRLPFSIQPGMYAVLFFYVGYLAKKKGIIEQKDRKFNVAATGLAALVWILYLYTGGGKVYLVDSWSERGLLDIPATVCASYVVIQISKVIARNLNWLKRILHFWGKNTLKILCLHLLELQLISWEIVLQEFGFDISKESFLIIFIMRLLWAGIGTLIINTFMMVIKRLLNSSQGSIPQNSAIEEEKSRAGVSDVTKGICILLLIYAGLSSNAYLRQVINSFCIPIFFVLSGFLYQKESIRMTFKNKGKSLLIPYLLVEAVSIFLTVWQAVVNYGIPVSQLGNVAAEQAKSAVLGMASSSVLLTDARSVGPVWFLICMFSAHIIYSLIVNLTGERGIFRGVLVLIITVSGWAIGKFAAFMPWNLDVAMVSVSLLYFGSLLKKYDLLGRIRETSYILVVGMVWVIGILCGEMDMAVRAYPVFPVGLIGAAAGSIMVMMVGRACIQNEMVNKIFGFCGRWYIMILGIYTLESLYCSWADILPGVSGEMIFILKIIFNISCVCIILSIKWALDQRSFLKVRISGR